MYSRCVRRLVPVLVVLLLSLAPARVATAQLGPNAPAPLTQPEPPPPPKNEGFDDGGLSALQKVLIFGSAILVLATIGWFIVRDAHRAAPVQDRAAGVQSAPAKMPARERERRQRQRRAKEKAARAQRKRNRGRSK
jgi:hypothetical protein